MKTLKKTLCLVLAVVMVVGVLILPAYAADDYDDAIEALQNYGVLQGYPDGGLHTDANITRGQMAAIIYRIMTGDTSSTNDEVTVKYGNYANKFSDANTALWAKGYIGFCANKGVLKGYDTGAVQANKMINGYEVRAMLLRALGYDKNNEYTGNEWRKYVLADSTQTGISTGVTVDPALVTPRGAVAQLTYNATTKTPMVAPAVYPNIGYNSLGKTLIADTTKAISTDVFGAYTSTMGFQFNWPVTPVEGSYALVTKPLWETWDAVTECDVAKGLGVDGEHWATTYTNGVAHKNFWNGNTENAYAMAFQATDTVNKIGHEGRHFMVYANPAFTGTESQTNPAYIFVFVDEFYAKVDSIVSEVTDPAGHVLVEASANVTVYSNDYATGAQTTATSANVVVLNTALTGSGYTAGQVLGVHMVTGDNNTMAGSTIVTKAPYAPVVLKTAQVTVKEITMDSATGTLTGTRPVGIIATNGTHYYYDYTFGKGTSGSAPTQITGSEIGKEVVLTLDSQNNIINWAYASSADVGYGVTLGATVKQVSIGQYALTYTILKPDGSTVTIDVGQATTGAAFTQQSAAETFYTGTAGANKLVYFAAGTTGPYNTLTVGNVTGLGSISSIKSGRPEGLTENYATDPVRGGGTAAVNGALVNDKTVFFVANYAPDNTTPGNANDYKFIDYSVYVGDKNIPDLGFATSSETSTNSNGTMTAVSNLTVEAFSGTPSSSPAAGSYASYVLVVNATKQSKPTAIPTMDFAYLITNDLFVNVGANTFTYPAIINGKPGQSLQVKLAGSPLSTQGLYSYADWVNGVGYDDVVLMDGENTAGHSGYTTAAIEAPYNGDFEIEANHYSYANGVLTAYTSTAPTATPATDKYYTVADGCPVYLINPTTGAVSTGSLGLLSVSHYAENCDIWFQLDANGYVSLIYVIENAAATTPVAPSTNTFAIARDATSATPSAAASATAITLASDGITSTGTGTGTTGTAYNYTAKISVWTTGTGWVEFSTGTGTGTVGTNLTSINTGVPLPATGSVVKVSVTATCGTLTSGPVEFSFATT